jgi:hypothetical protein
VKDVLLHLLDDDLGWLSRGRDADLDGLIPMDGDYRDFVAALNQKVWVSETRWCRSCHHPVLVDQPAEAVRSMWSLGVDVYNDVGPLARRARATLSE